MRSIRLSVKTVRELHTRLQGIRSAYIPSVGEMAKAEELMGVLQAALTPSRSVKAASSRRSERKATKREKTAAVREAVMARADGCCECGCGLAASDFNPLEMDHFFGGSKRRSHESVEGCWALLRSHHHFKSLNEPSAYSWAALFRNHCQRYGYVETAREAERAMDRAADRERMVAR